MNDWCNRCLVIVDTRISVVANWTNEDGQLQRESMQYATQMSELLSWLQTMKHKKALVFQLDNMYRAFIPVATWHGDPVCEVHLIDAVEMERKFRYSKNYIP